MRHVSMHRGFTTYQIQIRRTHLTTRCKGECSLDRCPDCCSSGFSIRRTHLIANEGGVLLWRCEEGINLIETRIEFDRGSQSRAHTWSPVREVCSCSAVRRESNARRLRLIRLEASAYPSDSMSAIATSAAACMRGVTCAVITYHARHRACPPLSHQTPYACGASPAHYMTPAMT